MNEDSVSIGTQLGHAREAKGWTVAEAARRTKLKADAIHKMESDEFDLFPSISYARGFIRIYARELGLNGWELMRNFEDAPDVAVEGLDLQPEDLESIPRRTQPPLATTQGIGLFVIVLVFLACLTLVGIKIYQIWPGGDSLRRDPSGPASSSTSPEYPPGEAPSTQAPPAVAKAVPSSEPVEVAPAAEPVKTYTNPAAVPVAPAAVVAAPQVMEDPVPARINRLRLRAPVNAPAADRWVRVTAIQGGQESILYEALIPPGATVPDPLSPAWSAEQFRIKFRQAAAIQIIFNETNFGTYERPGVQTVQLPTR